MRSLRFMTGVAFSFLLFLSAQASWASNVHGVLRVVKGDVQVKSGENGSLSKAKLGGKVFPKDTVLTGKDSRAKIVMVDNNEINISPDSQIEIKNYEFNPNEGKKEVLLNVIYGKVRSKVEQKYDGKTSHFQVKTPSAVAGVRGTDFITGFNRQSNTSSVVTFQGKVDFGVPGPNGSIANAVSVTPGQQSSSTGGQAPSTPAPVPKEELSKMDNDSKADSTDKGKQDNKSAAQEEKKEEKKEDKKEEKKDEGEKKDSGEKKDGEKKSEGEKKSDDGKKAEGEKKSDDGGKKAEGERKSDDGGKKAEGERKSDDGGKKAEGDKKSGTAGPKQAEGEKKSDGTAGKQPSSNNQSGDNKSANSGGETASSKQPGNQSGQPGNQGGSQSGTSSGGNSTSGASNQTNGPSQGSSGPTSNNMSRSPASVTPTVSPPPTSTLRPEDFAGSATNVVLPTAPAAPVIPVVAPPVVTTPTTNTTIGNDLIMTGKGKLIINIQSPTTGN